MEHSAITSINSYIGGMLVVEQIQSPTVTISSTSYERLDINVAKTGYTAIGVVGTAVNTVACRLAEFQLTSSTNVQVYALNRATSLVSFYCFVNVLYVKNMS